MGSIPEPRLSPMDKPEMGACIWCGGELYVGNLAYRGSEGVVHQRCMIPLLLDKLGLEYLAALGGYREEIL